MTNPENVSTGKQNLADQDTSVIEVRTFSDDDIVEEGSLALLALGYEGVMLWRQKSMEIKFHKSSLHHRNLCKKKVLLIGWDAADWKVIHPLMDQGWMPSLKSLVENGVSGKMATLDPPLSPMLWTSIATGKRPFKHGIHGFYRSGSGQRWY